MCDYTGVSGELEMGSLFRRAGLCATMGWLFYVSLCCAQDMTTQAGMHTRIVGLYNFHPAKLDDAGRKAKSAEMDKFWKDVKADPDHELPLLRVELRDTSNPAFFMTDGSQLLLALSKKPDDRNLAINAMSRCDLSDVDNGVYFSTLLDLAVEGFDTTPAVMHMLDYPKFAVPVPMHAMTLDQGLSLIYVLVQMDTGKWIPEVERRFAVEKDETALKSLLALFFFMQTPETDRLIASTADDRTRSEATRKEAQEYQKEAQDALKEKTGVKGTESSIRAARKKRLHAVSDEALDDVTGMTIRIIQLRHAAK
jgi:hypothetical protein